MSKVYEGEYNGLSVETARELEALRLVPVQREVIDELAHQASVTGTDLEYWKREYSRAQENFLSEREINERLRTQYKQICTQLERLSEER